MLINKKKLIKIKQNLTKMFKIQSKKRHTYFRLEYFVKSQTECHSANNSLNQVLDKLMRKTRNYFNF
jgi:hypothetical protein